jgi:hypothetical protein
MNRRNKGKTPFSPVGFGDPYERPAPAGAGRGPWHSMAWGAGVCGAFPFVGALWLPFYVMSAWHNPQILKSEILGWVLLGTLPLVPCAVALSRAGRAWQRVAVVVLPPIIVGALSLFLFLLVGFVGGFRGFGYGIVFALLFLYFLVGFVGLAVGAIGVLLGLASLGPCWRRGDAEGRALALLGLAPALGALGFWSAVTVSSRYPGFAAALDPSWLFRWEYLLAVVAVGLAAGALHVLAARRRPVRPKPFPTGDDVGGISREAS